MDIYIARNVGTGIIRSKIEKEIIEAGHEITEHPGFASYGVGCQDSDFGSITPENQIIFHEGDGMVYKPGQKLIRFGTLQVIGTDKTLGDWLKTAEDRLAAAL